MARIGLINVDKGEYPNLPLMKLSAWHKKHGDVVELFDNYTYGHFDRVYMSKVFTFTEDYTGEIDADEVVKGGSGYFYPDGGEQLPPEIEGIYPDYSLYNITSTAYGFLTRGCPRLCGFCIVGQKEGRRSVKVANLSDFWKGQKNIVLLDPNLLACKDHLLLLEQLKKSEAKVNFSQGLDIRLITDENTKLLKKLKIDMIHFAWDNYQDKEIIVPKFEMFKKAIDLDRWRLVVYVLCDYNTTIQEDLDRIKTLYSMGYFPYVMLFEKHKLPAQHIYRKIQHWANSKHLLIKFPVFEDYLNKEEESKKTRKKENYQKWNILL
jgi:hypothetical protein